MSQERSFQLLAPTASSLTGGFLHAITDPEAHAISLSAIQQLRGNAYLKDGAIQYSDLTNDRRFVMAGDEEAWHLLLRDKDGLVIGCVRFLLYDSSVAYDQLKISLSAIARDPVWEVKVRQAVESDLHVVRSERLHYVEVGGWALVEKWRNTKAAFEILMAAFALGSLWGGCVGSCTATVRHSSSSMLRRLGGESFSAAGSSIPAYADPSYGCHMEILRFDYRHPAARFSPLIEPLKRILRQSSVIAARPDVSPMSQPATSSAELLQLQACLASTGLVSLPFLQNELAPVS